MRVGDDEPGAAQAATRERAQELDPERLGLAVADRHAEHLVPAVGVDADGNDHRGLACARANVSPVTTAIGNPDRLGRRSVAGSASRTASGIGPEGSKIRGEAVRPQRSFWRLPLDEHWAALVRLAVPPDTLAHDPEMAALHRAHRYASPKGPGCGLSTVGSGVISFSRQRPDRRARSSKRGGTRRCGRRGPAISLSARPATLPPAAMSMAGCLLKRARAARPAGGYSLLLIAPPKRTGLLRQPGRGLPSRSELDLVEPSCFQICSRSGSARERRCLVPGVPQTRGDAVLPKSGPPYRPGQTSSPNAGSSRSRRLCGPER